MYFERNIPNLSLNYIKPIAQHWRVPHACVNYGPGVAHKHKAYIHFITNNLGKERNVQVYHPVQSTIRKFELQTIAHLAYVIMPLMSITWLIIR